MFRLTRPSLDIRKLLHAFVPLENVNTRSPYALRFPIFEGGDIIKDDPIDCFFKHPNVSAAVHSFPKYFVDRPLEKNFQGAQQIYNAIVTDNHTTTPPVVGENDDVNQHIQPQQVSLVVIALFMNCCFEQQQQQQQETDQEAKGGEIHTELMLSVHNQLMSVYNHRILMMKKNRRQKYQRAAASGDVDEQKVNKSSSSSYTNLTKSVSSDESSDQYQISVLEWRTMVYMLFKCNFYKDGLHLLESMRKEGIVLDEPTITEAVKSLTRAKQLGAVMKLLPVLEEPRVKLMKSLPSEVYCEIINMCRRSQSEKHAKRIHAHMNRLMNIHIGDGTIDHQVNIALTKMYYKYDMFDEAIAAFDKIPMTHRDGRVCSSIFIAYSRCNKYADALELYKQMTRNGLQPTLENYSVLLNMCANNNDLTTGKKLYFDISPPLRQTVYAKNAVLTLLGKCGEIDEALLIFETIPVKERDIIVWDALLTACRNSNRYNDTLKLYEEMKKNGVKPSQRTYAILLKMCSDYKDLETGQRIYSEIPHELNHGNFVKSAAVAMFGKCGKIEEAVEIFRSTPVEDRNSVIWTAMLTVFSMNGHYAKALKFYTEMKRNGVKPDRATYVIMMALSATISNPDLARHFYSEIEQCPTLSSDFNLTTSVMHMLGKCELFNEALSLFNRIPPHKRDIIHWNTILATCRHNKKFAEALKLYEEMTKNSHGVKPDASTRAIMISMFKTMHLRV